MSLTQPFKQHASSPPLVAVFYDCDNVLAFTEALHIAKTIAVAAELGVKVTLDEWPKFQGLGDHGIFTDILKPRGASGTLEEYIRATSEHYRRNIGTIKPRPGIEKVLSLLAHLPSIVITAGDEAQVTANMRCLPDFRPMDIIHADKIEPEKRKPHRGHCDAGVKILCETYGWEDTPELREKILYIDDSNHGAKSGRDAGLKTIQWVLEAGQEGLPGVHAVVHDPAELLQIVRHCLGGLCASPAAPALQNAAAQAYAGAPAFRTS